MALSSAYFDNACIGRVPLDVAENAHTTVSAFSHLQSDPTDFTCGMFDRYEAGRAVIERVLSLPAGSVAYVENTSHGLGMIACALPLERRHNVLVCDIEFFSTVLCWKKRQLQLGFEVRPVSTTGGCPRVSDFARAADQNTKAIIVSSVQEINGFRVDIPALSSFAKSIGAFLIVDGIQEVGALDPHIVERDVDVYCAGGHKWLRNPFGMGFMYINPRIIGQLEPDFYSYFNAKAPNGGWGPYLESPNRTPFDPLELAQNATKFETGATVNYIGAFSLVRSFELLEELGVKQVEREVLKRRLYLQTGLMRAGASICGSTQESTLSGICTFNLDGGVASERALMAELARRKIYCSLRYVSGVGGIRLSAHCYTGFDEIDYLLSVVRDFIGNKEALYAPVK